jgi:two-component system, chemotaxis family, chemotaxis protein CheY
MDSANEDTVAGAHDLATPGRLLVVDDDTIHRMVICSIAEKLNFAPTAASSFDEAVDLLKSKAFDCITLDLSLGNRHGAEMLPFIAMTGSRAPLIIISGANDAIREDTVRVAQMLSLTVVQLAKPVNLSELRNRLAIFHPAVRATLAPSDTPAADAD